MASLLADPIAWWPFGLVVGAVIGEFVRRHDGLRPRRDDPTGEADRSRPPGPIW